MTALAYTVGGCWLLFVAAVMLLCRVSALRDRARHQAYLQRLDHIRGEVQRTAENTRALRNDVTRARRGQERRS
jgi:type II secretory pathway component PulM